VRYILGSRTRELTLGNYPDLTLSAARKLTAEHRVAFDTGQYPAAEKRKERLATRGAWIF
jgi:hypothetical protein